MKDISKSDVTSLKEYKLAHSDYEFSPNIEINELAYKIISNITEGIVVTDENGVIEWTNSAVVNITGYSKKEVIGNKPSLFKSNKHDYKFYEKMWKSLKYEGEWEGEIWNRRKNGEAYPEHLRITSIKNSYNKLKYVAIFNDLTQKERNKAYIKYNANYDFLTGLPNRFLIKDRLKSSLNQAKKTKNMVALIYIDLDSFKRVNDGLGHDIGDELLKKVSNRILYSLNENQTLARMGADQFLVLIPFVNDEKKVLELANNIGNIFNEPFNVNKYTIYMTTSIGISIYPEDGVTENVLIKNAETAMSISKDISGNKYTLYNSKMNELSNEKIIIENDIRRGIEEREFELYYQPKINIKNEGIMGLEALIRWNHPLRGSVSPDEFIPIAEETGLIDSLGKWILNEAIYQQEKWINMGYKFGAISINLSPKQFKNKDIKTEILLLLSKSKLESKYIEFEITETAAIESEEYTLDLMTELTELGIKFAIDDFGTGYSSLSYLINLPFDTIKIDKSFIDNISKGSRGIEIVKGIIAMANSLKMNVIAEGVETKEQLDILRELECDMVQGYYYNPPIPADKIEKIYGIKK
ncbi:EAL domain-containing protein [Clostridium sp. D2Q-11]|uniref:EAL domain-containing protein n=1 Tax=Anaeromonas frigoriresistens TaxID=2683708 RepID=A0A942Z9W2_9FIRM|nr:EAL domain-containing protein [Anaeromonas frigoriresistens]MBS4539240.1 EAL domain-containing protein [Anaeromonas frigoriresistens]